MKELILSHQWIIWLVIMWTIPWKGIALWKAARRKHITWFVILLVFNTLAILEIIYIFVFAKKLPSAESVFDGDEEENLKSKNINQIGKTNNGKNLIPGL